MPEVYASRSAGRLLGIALSLFAVVAICVAGLLVFRPELLSWRDGRLVQSVTISPPDAVNSGAQWRIVGQWQGAGVQDSGNFYLVEFKPVPGWEAPAPIVLKKGKNSESVEGVYRPVKFSEKVILRLAGASTVGDRLAPELAQLYLSHLGADEVRRTPSKAPHEVAVQGIFFSTKEIKTIEIAVKGTSAGFAALKAKECDLAMVTRLISEKDVASMSNGNTLLTAEKENLFALDGVSIVTHLKNPVQALSVAQIRQIFNGEISNWSQLGGPSAPIKVFVLGENFGTRAFFDDTFMNGTKYSSTAHIVDVHPQLAEFVAQDPGAIGFCSVVFVNQCREIAVKAADGAEAFEPTPQNIRSNKYLATRKMLLYPYPDSKNVYARDFIRMAQSAAGQSLVKRYGFVIPELDKTATAPTSVPATVATAEVSDKSKKTLEEQSVAPNATGNDKESTPVLSGVVTSLPEALPVLAQPEGKSVPDAVRREVYGPFRAKVHGATHLPVLFRFESGSVEVNEQITRSVLALIPQITQQKALKQVVVVGFSDALGDYATNLEISRRRAAAVADVFKSQGVGSVEIVAAGEEYPLASNDDKNGREKNRRVEVWVR